MRPSPTDIPIASRLPDVAIFLSLLAALGGVASMTPLHALGFSAWLLVAGAAATALGQEVGGQDRTSRLGLAFVLAAFACLPSPAGLVAGLAAIAAGRGAALAGLHRRGIRAATANVAALIALQTFFAAEVPTARIDHPYRVVALGAGFCLAQLVAYGLGWTLEYLRATPTEPPSRSILRRTAVEALTVPLAWLLAMDVEQEAWAAAWAVTALVVLAAIGLSHLHRARRDLAVAERILAARVTELDTLHAIGREILSSLEPSRLFAIVERECRKIFPADAFFIALVERDSGLFHEVRRRDVAGTGDSLHPLESAICHWVLSERRGLRIDDLASPDAPFALRAKRGNSLARSVMAVPLVVEGRILGVVGLESETALAYDEHFLALLTTIAQQAAVAVENARNYAMATIDSLTGVYLRDYFFRRVDEEYGRARRYNGIFSVLMVDLDGFKAINDRHGHLAGDRYLRAVGATIRTRLRSADLACRYGGDEFCLLLPETNKQGARQIAERLRQAVSRMVVDADGVLLRSTVSIGIASFPENDSGDLRGLLLRADQALYRAKKAGRDRVVEYAA